MPYDLRPLTLAELLDRAFGLYRRHFWLFVGIMALPSLAMLILSVASQFLERAATLSQNEQAAPDVNVALVLTVAVVMLLTFVLYWISYAVALGATAAAVSGIYTDRTPTIAESYRAVSGKVARLALLLVIIGFRMFGVMFLLILAGTTVSFMASFASPILVGFGVFLTIVAGFGFMAWMFLRYAVSVPAAVLEDNTASDAIARSIELTQGSLHRVFLLLVFTVIVTYAALLIFQAPFAIAGFLAGPGTPAGFWLNLVGVVTGSLASALTGPLAVVAMAVLYYDLRTRNEGLDLELMVAKLSQAVPSAQPGSSSAPLPG